MKPSRFIPSMARTDKIKMNIDPPPGYRWLRPDEEVLTCDLIWKIRNQEEPGVFCQQIDSEYIFYVIWEPIDCIDFEIFREKKYVRKIQIDMAFWGLLQ